MPPPEDGPGVGELSRMVRDVLVRFEGLASKLETQFVRNDNFQLYKQLVDQAISGLQDSAKNFARLDRITDLEKDLVEKAGSPEFKALKDRVTDLEDDKKWLTRLLIGFIILAVLAAVFAVSKQGGITK